MCWCISIQKRLDYSTLAAIRLGRSDTILPVSILATHKPVCYNVVAAINENWQARMPYRFEWNSHKATLNLRRHGVSFDEASTVFDDPLAAIFDDETHSVSEVREIIVGHSIAGRLLLVSFTERPGEMLRLISARDATKKERQDYEENLKS